MGEPNILNARWSADSSTRRRVLPPEIAHLFSPDRRILWLGGMSAEERCSASLSAVAAAGLSLSSIVAVDYTGGGGTDSTTEAAIDEQWDLFVPLANRLRVTDLRRVKVNPYSFNNIQLVATESLRAVNADLVIVDLTSLTKIHTIALAAAKHQNTWPISVVAYTRPENYTNLDSTPAWRDIIMTSLASSAVWENEFSTRGVLLPGHESVRLTVALSEVEPVGGVLLIAETPKRPDLAAKTASKNRRITKWLKSRSPGSWKEARVSISDMIGSAAFVREQAERARDAGSPIVLFPFGPKTLVFAAAAELSRVYPQSSWFVYPVPQGFHIEDTFGVDETSWFETTDD